MFDTLAYANKLKSVGVESKIAEAQAELQAQLLSELAQTTLATKADIDRLENKIESLIKDLLIKLGGLIIGVAGVLAALSAFFSHSH